MSERPVAALKDMANRLRIDSIQATSKAGSGHPTSCCSMAEITAVLFFDTMKFHVDDPRNPNNDRFILSKGHAAPILYAAWAEAGKFPTSELLRLRELDCELEGHPTPRLDFVDVATGSLGQGLSAGCGMAYSGKYLDKADYRIYVLMGDGESAEGSIWEAASFASHYKLDNLVAIVDVNRLGQSEPTMFQHDTEVYRKRFDAFGWNTLVVDGHDVEQLLDAFDNAKSTTGRPTAIIAKTFKGAGIPGIENADNWHGKALGDKTDEAIAHLQAQLTGTNGLKVKSPSNALSAPSATTIKLETPNYKKGDKIATRKAYGTALAKLGSVSDRVVALDGDTKNSTFALDFKNVHPDRFVECFIAEQNLVGVGVGLATRGKIPFVSTFACFLSRAYDQLRMAAISQSTANFVGSHAGVSIGEDGPSQMALEDLAMFRAIPNCAVFYPSDAVSTERAVELAANYQGMTFIRTSRPNSEVIYDNDEVFEIGKANVVRSSPNDKVTVVAACVTLTEAMAAADELAKEGIHIRIVDPFTIKPLDRETILDCAKQTGGKILTVEDHYVEGGIGEAVAGALSCQEGITVYKLAVPRIPHSGQPGELMSLYGIDAKSIIGKIKQIIS